MTIAGPWNMTLQELWQWIINQTIGDVVLFAVALLIAAVIIFVLVFALRGD